MPAYSDDYSTPQWLYGLIAQHIPAGSSVWDPFYNDGAAKERMEEAFPGCTVHHENKDAFTDPKPEGVTHIVTNPPFSIKAKCIRAMLAHGLPTFMLMPVEVVCRVYSNEFPLPALVCVRKTVKFDGPTALFDAPFPCTWFCWNVPGVAAGTFRCCP